jgi:uncharacterized protein YukE
MTLIPILTAVFFLFVGGLIGWLIEWQLDLHYREAHFKKASYAETRLETLKAQLAQSEAEVAALRQRPAAAPLTELSDEARQLHAQLDDLQTANAEMELEWQHELARRDLAWQEKLEAELATVTAAMTDLRVRLMETQTRLEHYEAARPENGADSA